MITSNDNQNYSWPQKYEIKYEEGRHQCKGHGFSLPHYRITLRLWSINQSAHRVWRRQQTPNSAKGFLIGPCQSETLAVGEPKKRNENQPRTYYLENNSQCALIAPSISGGYTTKSIGGQVTAWSNHYRRIPLGCSKWRGARSLLAQPNGLFLIEERSTQFNPIGLLQDLNASKMQLTLSLAAVQG